MKRKIQVVLLAVLFAFVIVGAKDYFSQNVYAQVGSPTCSEAEVSLDTGNGYGSYTGARRFLNTNVNLGTDISYTDSTGNGSIFTINKSGLYSISYSGGFNTSVSVILNGNTLTYTSTLSFGQQNLCSGTSSCSVTVFLSSGDFVYPFGGYINPNTGGDGNQATKFTIVKVR